jgi:tRNA pseudouridine38-40 synthase
MDNARVASFALRLAYDGGNFHGWWRQPGRRTVAGILDAAFARLGEADATPLGAARTDAGVHARGQVAQVSLRRDWTAGRLLGVLNGHLPEDCSCTGVAAVSADWHACHHATGKTYRYRIDDRGVPDPFVARLAWRTPFTLDLTALQAASAFIPGHRDWRGFSRRGDHRDDMKRTITACSWERHDGLLIATVSGDGFTYHLVRSLVGACVAVANGTCHQQDLAVSLEGADSPAGRQQAPAHGLCLEHVQYRDEPAWVTSKTDAH